MIKNKPLINKTILLRCKNNDPPSHYSLRNKASPLNEWGEFKPFICRFFDNIYNQQIDGVRLKFKHVTLTINGRHKSN